MNNQEKEFNKAAEILKGVSLSASEKNAMRKHIYEIVGERTAGTKAIPSPFIYSSFFKRRTLVALTVVFLMTASTSYASFASLASLPGDPLYGMKVGVLEPIGEAVRFKEEERNDYRINLLRERVAEIERLKEDGRLESYNEMVSSRAAQRTVANIESSSSFNVEAENTELSSHVETYNAIILGDDFKLKTKAKIDLKKEERRKGDTSDKDTPILSAPEVEDAEEVLEEAEDAVEELTKPAKEVAPPVVKEVNKELEEVVEKVTPIELPKIIKVGL